MAEVQLLTIDPLPSSQGQPWAPFDQLYEQNFDFVWRTLRRLGVHEANVSDATQDVFIVVSRRLPDLRAAGATRSFIYGTIVRVAHEHRRAQKRAAPLAEEPPELADGAARNAQQSLELARDVRLLDTLLAELDEDKREVFVLVELEQLTVPEIAQLTQLNLNTIYSRLRGARAAFDSALARQRAKEKRPA